MGLPQILKDAGLVKSNSEAMRMIKQSAVKIDGEKIVDTRHCVATGGEVLCQVGKRRFAKVRVLAV